MMDAFIKKQIFVIVVLMAMAAPVAADEAVVDKAASQNPAVDGVKAPHDALGFFSQYISPIDGDRCPMHPSCSQYSRRAFQKHGLILGWIMTCDRLMRCGRDELTASPRVVVDGTLKCHDPVESNDFWWSE